MRERVDCSFETRRLGRQALAVPLPRPLCHQHSDAAAAAAERSHSRPGIASLSALDFSHCDYTSIVSFTSAAHAKETGRNESSARQGKPERKSIYFKDREKKSCRRFATEHKLLIFFAVYGCPLRFGVRLNLVYHSNGIEIPRINQALSILMCRRSAQIHPFSVPSNSMKHNSKLVRCEKLEYYLLTSAPRNADGSHRTGWRGTERRESASDGLGSGDAHGNSESSGANNTHGGRINRANIEKGKGRRKK